MDDKAAILIVDDQPEFREIFSTALGAAGYQVLTASSGKEAIALAKEKRPALILMDVQMPEMSGVEALMKLKEDPATKDIKAMFLTNLGNVDTESQLINNLAARDIQAEGYLKKTDDLAALVAEVKRHIG